MTILAQNNPQIEDAQRIELQNEASSNQHSSSYCQRPQTKYQTDWQAEIADMITSAEELLTFIGLNKVGLDKAGLTENKAGRSSAIIASSSQQFPVRVTRSFARRMAKGNPSDPLLLQVLPQLAESLTPEGFSAHPLNETEFQRNTGILQKYKGRVLLILTGACAIHCRYCFRRHFPYHQHQQSRTQWQQALQNILLDKSLHEVILSGGDPLMLTDPHLGQLIQDIAAIPQISTLRIHTRLPVVLPSRVTPQLLDILASTRLNVVVVIHSNHPNEIDQEAGIALRKLHDTADAMLNQTVLLRGINDNSEVLACLSRKLFSFGTLPYYLHLLDKITGAAHFEASSQALGRIMPELRGQLPGYLVPRVVREIPGETSKTPVWL